MNIPDAARALDLAESTLRWQIKNGKLRARRMGGRWYVSDEEVTRYQQENKRKGVDHVAQ